MKNCYIDLDGVLAKCHQAALAFYGVTVDEYPPYFPVSAVLNERGFSFNDRQEFWDAFDANFWQSLPPYEWNADLISGITSIFDRQHVHIATRPTRNPQCRLGKMVWCQLNLPDYLQDSVIFIDNKHLLGYDSVLVDDDQQNCLSFGRLGQAVLVGRPWNGHETQTLDDLLAEIEDASTSD